MLWRDEGPPPAGDDRPVVAVYSDRLFKASETYIPAQGESVRRYRSHYVCMHHVAGLDVGHGRTSVLNDGGGRINDTHERLFKMFGVSPRVDRTVRALRPALIHAHMGQDGAIMLPVARRLGLPLVVTFHGFDATATDETLRRLSLRTRVYLRRREALKREAQLVVAVSEFTRDRLLERGFPVGKTVVHYIGVDREYFRPDPAVAREPIALFVGRLIEKKGAAHLIAAMREVQARLPSAELVLAGTGAPREALERQAREEGVRATFLGRIRPEEVRAWMGRARVLCVPSVRAANGDAEGLPIVALEAMAMGLPVVGSRSAGIPEAVVHGETGLLGAEGDRAALASNLHALLGDPDLWQRMSAAAMRRVEERFDLRRQTAALEDLYDQARAAHARGVARHTDHTPVPGGRDERVVG
jgi:colanic acid/amylovoran biosynthesis glycosyltransferase